MIPELDANSPLTNLLVTLVVALLVVFLPWADRKLCGRLGLNLRGGLSANPRADGLLKIRQGILTSGLAVYLLIFFWLTFLSRAVMNSYAVHVAPLEDLKNLVMKYMPPVCGQQDIFRALTCIFSLQEDLARHILVEDGILVPIVNRRMHTDLESRFETPGEKGEELSSREKEILVCVAKGMLNKEIADAENISIHTVITHRKNITRKTGIKTVAGLTVYALLNNLIDINTIE